MELTGQYRFFTLTIIILSINSFVNNRGVDAGRGGIGTGKCIWIRCRSATQECPPGYYVAKMRPCRRRPERTQLRCCPLSNNTVIEKPTPTIIPPVTSATSTSATTTTPEPPEPETPPTFPIAPTSAPQVITTTTQKIEIITGPPATNKPSTSTAPTAPEPPTVSPSPSTCQRAETDDFPYTVALIEIRPGQSSRHFCGGAILQDNFVLTSAQCVKDKSTIIMASAADMNLNIGDNQEQRVLVDEIIVHPDYNSNSMPPNDIALLRLKWPFTLNEYVSNITIAPKDYDQNSGMGTVMGWEEEEIYSNKGDPNLQNTDVSFVSYDDCSAVYSGLDCETQMCTTSTTCPRDMGSPLVCPTKSRETGDNMCGIVSSPPSNRKQRDDAPLVHTFVPYYSDWIQKAMTESTSEESSSTTETLPPTVPTTEETDCDNESTTESDCDNETTTESDCDNESTTESDCDNETTTESDCDNETTTESDCDNEESTTESTDCEDDSTTTARPSGPSSTNKPDGSTLKCTQEDIKTYPFTVALIRQSAAIINDNTLLTAAHCFYDRKTNKPIEIPVLAIAGTTDLNEFPNSMQILQVEKVTFHESYDSTDRSQYADIALLTLSSELQFNEYVQPAKLPPDGFDTSKGMATVTGWEVIELYSSNGQNSVFQRVDVNIIPDKQCSSVHRLIVNPKGKEKLYPDSQICVTSDDSHSSCPGDSGGPLVCTGNFVCGVLSLTSDYVRGGVPTVYTDVTAFKSWIQQKMISPTPDGPEDCDNSTETESGPSPPPWGPETEPTPTSPESSTPDYDTTPEDFTSMNNDTTTPRRPWRPPFLRPPSGPDSNSTSNTTDCNEDSGSPTNTTTEGDCIEDSGSPTNTTTEGDCIEDSGSPTNTTTEGDCIEDSGSPTNTTTEGDCIEDSGSPTTVEYCCEIFCSPNMTITDECNEVLLNSTNTTNMNCTCVNSTSSSEEESDGIAPRCSDAPRNKFPHVIAVIFQDPTNSRSSHICSGSIIDESWIVTSASCFINPRKKQALPLENMLISAGDFDLNTLDGSEQICQIENVFFPDCYDPNDPNQLCNIAAVKLLWPLSFNPFVQPIPVQPLRQIGTTGIIAGWDIKELNTYSGNSILQSIVLPIVQCPISYYGTKRPDKTFEGSQMCSGTTIGKGGSECPLDIGAGLLCKTGNSYSICGIASSTSNNPRTFFHIYTSTVFFKSWLDATISGTTGTTTEMATVDTNNPGDLPSIPVLSSTTESSGDASSSWRRCRPGTAVPYQVSLFQSDPDTRKLTYFCAGIIFNEQTIITAANCLYRDAVRIKLELVRIFAGGSDLRNHSTLQILQPDRMLPHERYETANPSSIDNIAIIRTTFPFVWNQYVSPATFPTRKFARTITSGVIGGWDIDDLYSNSGSSDYREITVPILPDVECLQHITTLHPDSQMCTFSSARIPNECGGIPGGPLLCEEDACGIYLGAPVRRGNGIIGPGLFTELPYYLGWLDRSASSPGWLNPGEEDSTTSSSQSGSSSEDVPNSWLRCTEAPITISIPIQVALIINLPGSITNLHFCDGAIMAENIILTSAACLFTPQTLVPIATTAITAIAGDNNLNIFEGTEQIVDIVEAIIHESFDINNSSRYANVALLRTGSPFMFNEYVQPLQFPSPEMSPTSGSVSGWDVEELYTDEGNPVLRRLTMPVISQDTCSELFKPLHTSSQFCTSRAIDKADNRDDASCSRFPGGPFMCGDFVCGITSSSQSSRLKSNEPYIFTKLLHYFDWTQSTLGNTDQSKRVVRTTTRRPNVRRTTMSNKGYVPPTKPTVSTTSEIGSSKCSIAKQTEFQHQVAIIRRYESNNVYICSGSIMNELYIVTAASCLYSTSGDLITLSELFVFAGDPNLNEIDGSEQIIRIQETIIHESYDKNDPNQFCNLALLRIKWPIVFNEFVNSAPLFQYNTIKGQVDVSGWGPPVQLFTGAGNALLRKSTERVVPCDRPNSSLKDAGKATRFAASQVCILSSKKSNSCPRDIGSGMFCDDGKFICGIASSSSHPVRTYNNIYTSLPFFRSWIQSKMKHPTNQVAHPVVGIPSSPKPEVFTKCRDAAPQEFQFQVSLISLNSRGSEKAHFCDGSLLSETYVLTAASCLFNENGQPRNLKHIIVSAGDPNPSTSGLQITQVEMMIIHDNFDAKSSVQNYNIALLKLKWPISINEYTAIIALPPDGLNISNVGDATAAGRENLDTRYEGNSNLRVSHLLLKACNTNTKMHPHFIQGREKIPSTVCAVENKRVSGTCPRDTGGPLICNDETRSDQYICGIAVPISQSINTVSFTFSSVAYHRSWIENKLTGNVGDVSDYETFSNQQEPSSGCLIQESSFTYQVALVKTDTRNNNYIHFCDAVIYSMEYVLTTASCVQNEDVKNIWVFAGYDNLNKLPTTAQILKIKQIIVHENYDKLLHFADIALLKLSQNIVFNEYISEAKFSRPLGSKGIVSGWNTKQLYSDDDSKSSFQTSTVPLVPKEHCARKDSSYNFDSQICVAVSMKQNACTGTKGGPLSEVENEDKVVYGIASGSPRNSHMVFTNIYFFQDWIYQKTATSPTTATNFGVSSSMSRPATITSSCSESNAMSFPFQVGLTQLGQGKPQHFCSGVIYNTSVVLTAAHCLINPRTKKLIDVRLIRVIAGDTDINKLDGTEQVSSVQKYIIHPHYNPGSGATLPRNDIAMILLRSSFKENDYIQSIRILQRGLPVAPSFGTIAGWKPSEFYSKSSKSLLHTNRVPLVSYNECRKTFEKGFDRNMHICAANDRTCKGDDGGPIVISFGPTRKPTRHLLYGISTFVTNDSSLPNVYTNVHYYSQWIDGSTRMSAASKLTLGTSSLNKFPNNKLRPTVKSPISVLSQDQHTTFQNCRQTGRYGFPFQVALILKSDNKSTHFCSGSLISNRYVLTSASCVLDKLNKFSDVYVFAGDNDLSKLDGSEQVIKVDEVTIHEDFDPNSSNQYFDLALLRLKWAVTVNSFVNVIQLPPREMNSSSISGGSTAGWGIIDIPSGPGNPILHEKEVKISSCSRFYLPTKNFNLHYEAKQFCSGSDATETSCRTEFGAPLVCSYNSSNYICGLSVYSSSSNKRNWDVFTDVSYFRSWIEEMMMTTTMMAEDSVMKNINKPRNSSCSIAEKASFKSQVALIEWDPETNTHAHFCSGSIISRSLLLTAAHCWFDESTETPKDIKYVRGLAGDHDLNRLEGTEVIVKIERVLFHQNYKPEGENQLSDIAVVKLKTPLVFDKFISSIPVPTNERFTINETGKVAGWEEVELFTNNGNSILQTVDMKMIPHNNCSQRFGDHFKVTPGLQLCLVAANESQSSCRGDFGGGYICDSNGEKYLCGIGSVYSDGNKFPRVYTNVSHFASWIVAARNALVTENDTMTETKPLETVTFSTPIKKVPSNNKMSLQKCEEAKPKSWPFQVALLEKHGQGNWTHFCGGAILNTEYIITSASCLFDAGTNNKKLAKNIMVHAGDTNLNVNEGNEQKFQVKKIFIHGNFDPFDATRHSDIGLIRLRTAFNFNSYVALAPAIPPRDFDLQEFKSGKVGGWEEIELHSKKGSPFLRTVEYQIISDKDCEQTYRYFVPPRGEHKIYPDMHICVGNGGTAQNCQGDLGGPMICNGKKSKYLCGVASINSHVDNVPHLYTDVAYFRNWIEWITQY